MTGFKKTIAALDLQIKRQFPDVQRVFVEAESKGAQTSAT